MSRPDDDDCAACFCRRAVHSADGCDGGGGGDPLCGCSGFVEETNVTDRHYLPPELAAQLLERQGGEVPLDDADRELITILAEECAEVVQRCTKILRFGLRVNPWTGQHNRVTLESEIGDIQATTTLLMHRAVIRGEYISAAAACKLVALARPDGRLRAAHAVAVDFQNTAAAPPVARSENEP